MTIIICHHCGLKQELPFDIDETYIHQASKKSKGKIRAGRKKLEGWGCKRCGKNNLDV